MRGWALLVLALLVACAPTPGPVASEEALPRARVRYLPATVPAAGWSQPSGQVRARPVRVSEGELLVFRQGSRVQLMDQDRLHELADFELRILERLDRDHLLVATDQLAVLELSTGKLSGLGWTPEARVSLDGRHLYLLIAGRLQDGDRPLSQRVFDRVLEESGVAFHALADGQLYRVSKQGGEQAIGRARIPPEASVALSPDHRHLALGFPGGAMQVLEVESGRLVRELKGLNVAVSRLSGRAPTVRAGWMDERTVRYSTSEKTSERDPEFYSERMRETPEGYFRWEDLRLDTGERYDRGRYGRMGLAHFAPVPETAREERVFVAEEISLWIPRTRVSRVAISWDGRRAVARVRADRRTGRLLLVDEDGTQRVLAEGPSTRDEQWLPPVGSVAWCPPAETGAADSRIFPRRTLRFFERTWETGEESPLR